ncbi:MAG: DUF1016 N-terminal domain-containing protein [Lentisphaeria bacterium]|jgi:hypothetical protein|nr:DUF1016 N-terminal domain-containing protein [Lentisphaeria bacterium]MDY0175380.1 DUF1016 N-terminal domain-containing protein [Lentisphaeria bacterium]
MNRKLKPSQPKEINDREKESALTGNDTFYADIAHLLVSARQSVYRAVNTVMVQTYWRIGQRIVEQEQLGQERAGYGEQLIVNLSRYLTDTLGKGFSEANLWNMRQFYLTFPGYPQSSTQRVENLAWSHIRLIMRLDNEKAQCLLALT